MKVLFLVLFIVGCNSQPADLSAIQGIRDPNNPFPFISSISLPSDGTYYPGNILLFNVTFSEEVEVSGVPQIGIEIDGTTIFANYSSGSGTHTLSFIYTVAAGEMDSDGITLTNPLVMTGGSIFDPDDSDLAVTDYDPFSTGILINGANPTLISITPPADGLYGMGANLNFTLNFDFPVIVAGSPYLVLGIGVDTIHASYVSGSGTTKLEFSVIIPEYLSDTNGIDLNGFSLNGGTMKDVFGDDAAITFSGTNYLNVHVDSNRPFSSGSAVVPADRTYYKTEVFTFSVPLTEVVTVSGTPRIALTIGSTTRYANYTSGSGTSTLTFQYTLQTGDNDFDGIAVFANFDFNGGAIVDLAGNNALSGLNMPSTSQVKVDGNSPTISLVGSSTTNATFIAGTTLSFQVSSGSLLYVNTTGGTPRLKLDIGGVTKYASYVSGSGNSTLNFEYVIEAGLEDMDGIFAVSDLELNGGTIKDGSSSLANDLILTFTNKHFATLLVDSKSPTIVSITPPTAGSYKTGSTLSMTVTFSESVFFSGTSISLPLTFYSGTVNALYTSGSGTNSLTFTYSITTGDIQLFEVQTGTTLFLASATLKDAVGNDADLLVPVGEKTLEKVFVIPSSLDYWYDVNDSTTIGVAAVGDNITQFKSKANTLNGTISGNLQVAAGYNGAEFVQFDGGSYIDIPSISFRVILVSFVTPILSSPSGEILYRLNSSENMEFQDAGAMNLGILNCFSCYWYSGASTWQAVDINGDLTGYDWTTQSERTIMLDYGGTNTKPIRLGEIFTGQIGEVMIFNAIPGAVELAAIENYFSVKHRATWDTPTY